MSAGNAHLAAICPGCLDWSIECDDGEDLQVVEAILKEHAAECPWLEALSTIMRHPEP